MPLFSLADIVQLRGVAELAFHDDYTVLRKPPAATRDSRGNRTNSRGVDFVVVEVGKGRMRREGLQPSERIAAEKLTSNVALAVDLPLDTLATAQDRLSVDGRTVHVAGVLRDGALAMVATAICEERF